MKHFLWDPLLAMASLAQAQSYPTRPIRLIRGFATGSAIDVMGRPLAAKLSELLGQQVIVDSRPGATGGIANEAVAKSAPALTAARAAHWRAHRRARF
jgi:tripartite-type tricarboxylate transporter receptor subunit TctC